MIRPLAVAGCVIFFFLCSPAPSVADVPPPSPQPPAPQAGAVRVMVETIAVDRRGTWSAGTDEADIFPGSSGVLRRTATLTGREAQNASREMVEVTAHIAPEVARDGACTLKLKTVAASVVAGARAGRGAAPSERKSVSVTLKAGEERLVEVYASGVTQGRLALKVRCGAPDLGAPPPDPEFIDFVLSIDRAEGEGQPETLKSNRLRAVLRREASDLFSFNVTLPEAEGAKRYRREQLEVGLAPQLISGGKLQLEVSVHGELATVSAKDATKSHPIDRHETAVVLPGEAHDLEIDVRSSGDEEGWSRVRYTIRILSRF